MSEKHLAVYLHDHRAGADAAVELLRHLEQAHASMPVGEFAAALRQEVTADIEALEDVMRRVGLAPSRTRQAAAWLSEKVVQLKMRLDDPGDGALRLLEVLEAVGMGIDGKRALWSALAKAAEYTPALSGVDYPLLSRRADEQRRAVEIQRLSAAVAALGL